MKTLKRLTRVLAVSAALFASGFVFTSARPDCPTPNGEIVLIPNREECSTYWECLGGVPYLRVCPEDLYYCSEKEYCSWNWDPVCTYDCTTTGGVGDWLNNVTDTCVSGGRGSVSCSINATIAGTGVDCSVSCQTSYYACCGLKGCQCIKG